MIQPRWKKVIQDLRSNKLRTLLVIASIAIGVFAVGTMIGTQILLTEELSIAYLKTSPSHALLFSDDVTTGFLRTVETVEGVAQVDARKHETVLLHLPSGDPIRLNIVSRLDYENMKLHTLTPTAGQWPPANNSIIIEQASLPYTESKIGDTVRIETADGQLHELLISGTAHDLFSEPVIFTEEPNAYVTRETMAALGYGYGLDELFVRIEGDNVTETAVETVTDRVQFKLANSGRIPYFAEIFEPDVHPATEDVEPMIMLLGVLAVLALFTSCFLIVNIITALLMRQTKQIGIMKAYSATRAQIMSMYLVGVTVYGILSFLVALPLASLATYGLTLIMAKLINFELSGFQFVPAVIAIQVGMALLVPLIAAFFPIRRGVATSVYEAMNEQGSGDINGRFNKLVTRISQTLLYYSRPLQMALRNAVRRKGRLLLTVLTLTFGSAIFISVMSVHASLLGALDDALVYYAFDDQVYFIDAVDSDEAEQVALSVPDVVQVETWIQGDAQRLSDGRASMAFALLGLDSDLQTIKPEIVNGRWLQPDDTNAIVLDSLVLSREPDIQLGDTVTLKIDGLQSEWVVVGFSKGVLTEDGVGYANRNYLAQKIGLVGKANGLTIVSQAHHATAQFELDLALREQFKAAGFAIATTNITSDIRDGIQFEFNLIIYMLVGMAILLSLIGIMGLSGTMSLNVLERTREIGIMRALGASNKMIRRIIIGEGVSISVMSWFFGSLLAYPLGKLLSDVVGNEVLESALPYHFATYWVIYWLLLIACMATFSSYWPARSAARLSVRETLAYE